MPKVPQTLGAKMKKKVKKFLKAHPRLASLLKDTKRRVQLFTLTETLRFRLFSVWLRERKPLLIICRFGAIGDVICTFPAVHALIRSSSGVHPVYVTRSKYAVLPEMAGVAATIIGSEEECPLPRLPSWMVAKRLDLRYTDEIDEKGRSRSGRVKPSADLHLVEEFFWECGVEVTSDMPILHLAPDLVDHVKQRLNLQNEPGTRIIAIHAGRSTNVREWPHEYWQELVERLTAHFNPKTEAARGDPISDFGFKVRILHIGSERYLTKQRPPIPTLHGCENLLDQLSLEETAALLSSVDLFIGIDSGVLHMAGAVGATCIGIFGSTDPKLRMPQNSSSVGVSHQLPCSYCHHRLPRLHWTKGCPSDIQCMTGLSVEKVFEEVVKRLDASYFIGAESMN